MSSPPQRFTWRDVRHFPNADPTAGEFRLICAPSKQVAKLEYAFVPSQTGANVLDIQHTFVPKDFRGRGIAALLCGSAFHFAQKQGVLVRPSCTYVPTYLSKEGVKNQDLVEGGFAAVRPAAAPAAAAPAAPPAAPPARSPAPPTAAPRTATTTSAGSARASGSGTPRRRARRPAAFLPSSYTLLPHHPVRASRWQRLLQVCSYLSTDLSPGVAADAGAAGTPAAGTAAPVYPVSYDSAVAAAYLYVHAGWALVPPGLLAANPALQTAYDVHIRACADADAAAPAAPAGTRYLDPPFTVSNPPDALLPLLFAQDISSPAFAAPLCECPSDPLGGFGAPSTRAPAAAAAPAPVPPSVHGLACGAVDYTEPALPAAPARAPSVAPVHWHVLARSVPLHPYKEARVAALGVKRYLSSLQPAGRAQVYGKILPFIAFLVRDMPRLARAAADKGGWLWRGAQPKPRAAPAAAAVSAATTGAGAGANSDSETDAVSGNDSGNDGNGGSGSGDESAGDPDVDADHALTAPAIAALKDRISRARLPPVSSLFARYSGCAMPVLRAKEKRLAAVTRRQEGLARSSAAAASASAPTQQQQQHQQHQQQGGRDGGRRRQRPTSLFDVTEAATVPEGAAADAAADSGASARVRRLHPDPRVSGGFVDLDAGAALHLPRMFVASALACALFGTFGFPLNVKIDTDPAAVAAAAAAAAAGTAGVGAGARGMPGSPGSALSVTTKGNTRGRFNAGAYTHFCCLDLFARLQGKTPGSGGAGAIAPLLAKFDCIFQYFLTLHERARVAVVDRGDLKLTRTQNVSGCVSVYRHVLTVPTPAAVTENVRALLSGLAPASAAVAAAAAAADPAAVATAGDKSLCGDDAVAAVMTALYPQQLPRTRALAAATARTGARSVRCGGFSVSRSLAEYCVLPADSLADTYTSAGAGTAGADFAEGDCESDLLSAFTPATNANNLLPPLRFVTEGGIEDPLPVALPLPPAAAALAAAAAVAAAPPASAATLAPPTAPPAAAPGVPAQPECFYGATFSHRNADAAALALASARSLAESAAAADPANPLASASASASASSVPTPVPVQTLHADFANKFIGGGVLRTGAVQEEILFLISPECLFTLAFTERLDPKEAVFIVGAERFSSYTGYSRSFAFAGPYTDERPYDPYGRLAGTIVVIDAIAYQRPEAQFAYPAVRRDLIKALAGYTFPAGLLAPAALPVAAAAPTDTAAAGAGTGTSTAAAAAVCGPFTHSLGYTAVSTGNWGCGAFGGDIPTKLAIQWVACGLAGRSMLYHTFAAPRADNAPLAAAVLTAARVSVRGLWLLLHQYAARTAAREVAVIPDAALTAAVGTPRSRGAGGLLSYTAAASGGGGGGAAVPVSPFAPITGAGVGTGAAAVGSLYARTKRPHDASASPAAAAAAAAAAASAAAVSDAAASSVSASPVRARQPSAPGSAAAASAAAAAVAAAAAAGSGANAARATQTSILSFLAPAVKPLTQPRAELMPPKPTAASTAADADTAIAAATAVTGTDAKATASSESGASAAAADASGGSVGRAGSVVDLTRVDSNASVCLPSPASATSAAAAAAAAPAAPALEPARPAHITAAFARAYSVTSLVHESAWPPLRQVHEEAEAGESLFDYIIRIVGSRVTNDACGHTAVTCPHAQCSLRAHAGVSAGVSAGTFDDGDYDEEFYTQ